MQESISYLQSNWIAILALVVSVLSLGISGTIFYIENLRPFKLVARSAGRVTIAINPVSKDLAQDSILIDLILTNSGARRGVIEDIALDIKGSSRELFRSWGVDRDTRLNVTSQLVPPVLEAFTGFDLSKNESVMKRIMLVPSDTASSFRFAPGEYIGNLYIRASDNTEWVKHASIEFTVTTEDINVLNKSRDTATRDAAGGVFVTWYHQNKVLDKSEKLISKLKEELR